MVDKVHRFSGMGNVAPGEFLDGAFVADQDYVVGYVLAGEDSKSGKSFRTLDPTNFSIQVDGKNQILPFTVRRGDHVRVVAMQNLRNPFLKISLKEIPVEFHPKFVEIMEHSTIILDEKNLEQTFVDLPITTNVIDREKTCLFVNGLAQQYYMDYIIGIDGAGVHKRILWKNLGLDSRLRVGDEFKVEYRVQILKGESFGELVAEISRYDLEGLTGQDLDEYAKVYGWVRNTGESDEYLRRRIKMNLQGREDREVFVGVDWAKQESSIEELISKIKD